MSVKPFLLMEDNEDDAAFFQTTLYRARVINPVIVAVTAKAGLEMLFDERQVLPAALFLDLKLPDFGGQTVIRRIRAGVRTHGLRIIVLTGTDPTDELQKAFASGANDWLSKPIDFDMLLQTIRKVGLYWQVCDGAPEDW